MQAKTETETKTEVTHPDVWVNGIRYAPADTPDQQVDTPTCDTCRFARGTVCCAHPVTVKMPAARWCGEWKEKSPCSGK